jgi:hypothetical protein
VEKYLTYLTYFQSSILENILAKPRLEIAITAEKPGKKLSLSELSWLGGISSLGAAFTVIIPTIPKSS